MADLAYLHRRGIWPKQGGQQLQSSTSLLGISRGNSRPRKTSTLFPCAGVRPVAGVGPRATVLVPQCSSSATMATVSSTMPPHWRRATSSLVQKLIFRCVSLL